MLSPEPQRKRTKARKKVVHSNECIFACTFLRFVLNLIYIPTQVPVMWVEVPELIPAWDWTRGYAPTQAVYELVPNTQELVMPAKKPKPPKTFEDFELLAKNPVEYWSRDWSQICDNPSKYPELERIQRSKNRQWFLDAPPPIIEIQFPRVVREHPAYLPKKPIQTPVSVVLASFWRWIGKDKFKRDITEAISEIGLLQNTMGNQHRGNSLTDWELATLEAHFWRWFHARLTDKNTPLVLVNQNSFMASRDWEQLYADKRWSLKKSRDFWSPLPSGVTHVGRRRATLDGAGVDGEIVEIELGEWVRLNPDHPETKRCLATGQITPFDEPPLFDMGNATLLEIQTDNLFWIARKLARESNDVIALQKRIGCYLREQFKEACDGCLYFDSESDNVEARVGALDWARYELAQLFDSAKFETCLKCGLNFVPQHGNQIHCCDAHRNAHRPKRLTRKTEKSSY